MELDRMVALRLAKAGYGGGEPERVRRMPVDDVIEAYHYENFRADYERTWTKLNTGKK